jgi:hypothetical protein
VLAKVADEAHTWIFESSSDSNANGNGNRDADDDF